MSAFAAAAAAIMMVRGNVELAALRDARRIFAAGARGRRGCARLGALKCRLEDFKCCLLCVNFSVLICAHTQVGGVNLLRTRALARARRYRNLPNNACLIAVAHFVAFSTSTCALCGDFAWRVSCKKNAR